MKKLFTFLFALIAGVGTICASYTEVNGIYYDFDKTTQTAAVTYHGDTYEDNEYYGVVYSGAVIIPSSVSYDGITYSVTSIGDYAFFKCSSLTSVTIPNSVTSIGEKAFYGCSGITSPVYNAHYFAYMPTSYSGAYSIPEGIPQIAGGAFYACTKLTSVTIPNSVTSIGEWAFEGCSGLTSVTIPNSVTTIEPQAFISCSGLTSVTIPSSVTTIRNYAFMACNNLYDVYCYASTPPTADQSSFTNYNAFLHVLCDNQQMYLSDEVFGKFQSVVCLGAEEVMTDGVTVVPGKNDAVFTWPTEGSANSYTLEIKKGGMVFCTLTFNANGQLTGIAFMPRPDGSTPATAATSVGAGYQFTVTGLDGASHYTYELTTKDAANQVIASYTGEFSTEGFTALEDAVIPSLRVVDGAVVCDEPYTIYDISGRDVTNQNGTLQGVYIVRTAKGAVKVVF